MPKQSAGRVATPLEIIAIAGAFKDKAIKDAKAQMEPGAHESVSLTCEISGTIAKAAAIAGEMVPPAVKLTTLPTFIGVLHELGIGVDRLERALMAVGVVEDSDDLKADELYQVFAKCERAIASSLPMVPAGTSPRVTSVLSVRVLKAA
ncbi:hypothetical protein [Schlesneria sp. DSM 10557]|uniref:hypothetical protein n=1 Tax=Schlesneria sp. DSM 10557 TaxID=3044399 RepID=UPI00359F5115